MKKFILMLAVMLTAVIGANAQTALEEQKPLDNIYIEVNGGATTPLDFNSTFPINGIAGLKIGKDFTPVFGTNVEGTTWFGDNHFMDGKTFVKSSYVGVNGTINLTNLFLGFRENRTFTFSTETGLGWIHRYNDQIFDIDGLKVGETETNFLGAKTGAVFAWNLGKAKAWYINFNPTVYWNLSESGKIQFNQHKAQFACLLGLGYHFKTSNGTHGFKSYDIGLYKKTISDLNAELSKKPREVVKEVRVLESKVELINNEFVVRFAQGSSLVTSENMEILNTIPRNATVDVVGTASVEGSEKFNKELSLDRAKAVAAYLKDQGVKVNKVDGIGESLGKTSNRLAIVKIVE